MVVSEWNFVKNERWKETSKSVRRRGKRASNSEINRHCFAHTNFFCFFVWSFGRTWEESQRENSLNQSPPYSLFPLNLLSLTVSVSFVRDALFAHLSGLLCLSFSLLSLHSLLSLCLHTQTSMDLVRATGASTWNPIMRCGNYEGAPRSSRSVTRWNSDRVREQFFFFLVFFPYLKRVVDSSFQRKLFALNSTI